ncbi:MAG: DinB family protein [Anaerolineae bacterium]|nr:DinB family protein [Anaerolineae bacterium]
MPHPLVDQLRFTRSELVRALDGVTDDEARRRFLPMNCLSWIVGHLAAQEQYFWLICAQGKFVVPGIYEIAGYGQAAITPPLDDMWQAWRTVTAATDSYLDMLTSEALTSFLTVEGQPSPESIGSMLRRVTYHYWYHIGESQAIRQMLGHSNLPEFVGDVQGKAPYRMEMA